MGVGNPYKDEKGHYTSKENDGGTCHHTGSKSSVETPKNDYTGILDIDWQDKQKKATDEFKKMNEELDFPTSLEAAKRFTGLSSKWKMSDEEIAAAKKIIGGDLTVENINKWINERQEKQKIYEKTRPSTDTIETPEREQMRKKWIQEQFDQQRAKRDIKHDKIALITLGNAGSGKSSAGGKTFLNQYGAYEVDPDEFKKMIPEYQQDADMVGVVHRESSNLARDFMDQAIEEGANIFFPTTGSNQAKLMKNIEKLKNAGYQVYVDYIDLDIEENIVRTKTRALSTGRYTTSGVIGGSYKEVKNLFDNKLKKSKLIDGYRLWDNNKGPKIVEKGGKEL